MEGFQLLLGHLDMQQLLPPRAGAADVGVSQAAGLGGTAVRLPGISK